MSESDQSVAPGCEEHYRLVFESMQDGVLVADLGTGMFVLGNPGIARMLGCSNSDITALGHGDIHPAESLPMVQAAIARQLSGSDTVARDIPVLRRDGSVFFADINAVPFEYGGRPCILGIFRDITARRFSEEARTRAEEDRAAATEHLEATLNALPDLLFVVDTEGRIFDFRAPDLSLLYVKPSEFLGRRFEDVLPADAARVLRDSLVEAAATGRHSGGTYALPMHGEMTWYEFSIAARGAEDVMDRRFVVLVRDITKRKNAELALRESESFLQESQRVSGVGSYVLDVKRGVWTASETLLTIFGIDREHPNTVEAWADLLHPDDRQAIFSYFQATIAERGIFDRQYRIIRAHDGAERWVHGLGVLRLGDSGEPLSMTGTIQDVTDEHLAALEREHLLAAEQAARIDAELAVKSRDEFLSVAAHELKTPLAALRIVAEALVKQRAGLGEIPEFVQKSMETVDRQSQRMVRLVNALLDITRIQTGRFELNIHPVDLAVSWQSVIRRLEPSLDQAGCEVRFEGPASLVVDCDRDRMEQVFENLLSNAMKFASHQPIIIKSEAGDGFVRFTIRDHGRGIASGFESSIFELYDRGGTGLHAGGFGIGLYVCRRILEAHRGFIIGRNAEDGGAVFTMELPVPSGGTR